MGGHPFVQDSTSAEHLSPQHHTHTHLHGSTLILGPNQHNFQVHQHQQNAHHQDPSPPEIGSTTTMWEDIASSIKKLDPDHADVLLVASCSSAANVLVPSHSSIPQLSGIPTQHGNFAAMGEQPQMIVTSLSAQGETQLMQEQQQDCNNYVITSLPNNNSSSMCLLPSSNNENQSSHVGPTLISSGDNNFNLTVSSMAQTSATTNAFSSMSFDSTTASTHACISSFDSLHSQRDSKEGIITMEPVTLATDHDHRSHPHIPLQQQDSRHCQQHDINQNPSNPSAINSSSVSSQISYQQINPLIANQNSHSHHHPPHSNPHHIQLPSNANISNHRYNLNHNSFSFHFS